MIEAGSLLRFKSQHPSISTIDLLIESLHIDFRELCLLQDRSRQFRVDLCVGFIVRV